jgi:thiosulfate reductase cytochrome b subunit
LLGRWTDPQGRVQRRAFPHWATIPSAYSLAAGRRWHLAFAWILAISLIAFVATSLLNRHAQRDLAPRLTELRPQSLWHDIKDHARLRFPKGDERAMGFATTSDEIVICTVFEPTVPPITPRL